MAVFTAIGTAVGATLLGSAALAGAAIVGGGAAIGYSINRADKAASAQRSAAATQQRMQQQQATRQRRSAIRSSLVRRQQMLSQARALGAEGSSAIGGGISSLSSQLGANLGFGSMMSGLGQQYSSLTQQAADFTGQSQLFGQIGQILLGAPTFGATSTPTATSSAPVYNRENFSRARSGVNLAGGF
jgi:hypothetical protein